MPAIAPSRPNAYTGNLLDRVSARRGDESFVAAALADPACLHVPVWRARNLVTEGAGGAVAAVLPQGRGATLATGRPWALLGLRAGVPVAAVDLSEEEEEPAALALPGLPAGCTFVDLRRVAGRMPAEDASLLAYARGLMHWRARHRFCGVCGQPTAPRQAGHVLACTGCDAQHFPRTDPAVIMLVVHQDRALLGHSQRFPTSTMYSTLAGFVEPGESLEEAVAREVMEEAGIRVGRVWYHSSQPWPFPSSIMLGFHAEALSEEIVIDPGELTDARWFTRAQMRDPAAHGFALPRGDSIASRLIEDWLAA